MACVCVWCVSLIRAEVERNPLLAASPCLCRHSPLYIPSTHLAGSRGNYFQTQIWQIRQYTFLIFKQEQLACLFCQSPQTAPKKEGLETTLVVVVTPPPSSGQPSKLSPQQPTRSKPASVEARPPNSSQPHPKNHPQQLPCRSEFVLPSKQIQLYTVFVGKKSAADPP